MITNTLKKNEENRLTTADTCRSKSHLSELVATIPMLVQSFSDLAELNLRKSLEDFQSTAAGVVLSFCLVSMTVLSLSIGTAVYTVEVWKWSVHQACFTISLVYFVATLGFAFWFRREQRRSSNAE